jgi:hypothetical protein
MALGCGRAVMPSPPSAVCESEGEGCTCDEDRAGHYVCDDDAPTCVCDGDDHGAHHEDAGTRRDAGKDAGKHETGSEDAHAEHAHDAGDEPAPDPEEDAGPAHEHDASTTDPTVDAPRIPALPTDCPAIETGTATVLGQKVQLWVGEKQDGKRGPILFYWHDTDTSSAEALGGLGLGHAEILAEGGVVASFATSTRSGTNTGSNYWFTGDFAMADRILACAIVQRDVDPRRVYTAGCGAGGLQSSAMVYGRSSYLAAAMSSSGGATYPFQLEDPAHIPAYIGAHGAAGSDVVIVDFTKTTKRQTQDLAAKGGFAVACDHGGGHCASPAQLKNAQWLFLKEHAFGAPEPYLGGLGAAYPEFCEIVEK